MVTGRFLDELNSFNSNLYEVTVISAEAFGSYNRIMLSSVLSGDADIPSIVQKAPEWYEENNITLYQNEPVCDIDRSNRCVYTKQGRQIEYDHLVIATGSRSSKIPAKNIDLKNIFPFRSIDDTQNMLDCAKSAKTAIVVGGGFLGLEAAWGLAKAGIKVQLIHRSPWLLNRQLDKTAGKMLEKTLSERGLDFHLSSEIDSFLDNDGSVCGALLKNGTRLDCDMAVIATGITPNAELGWQAGLEGKRAIQVNAQMQTSDENISAIGECVEFEGKTFGLVDPLWRHAQALASRLYEAPEQHLFEDAPSATKLKISGINLYSAGAVVTPEGGKEIVVQDSKANIYRKLILQNNRIIGIVLYGDVRSGAWYFDFMQNQQDITSMLPNLLFGEAYCVA